MAAHAILVVFAGAEAGDTKTPQHVLPELSRRQLLPLSAAAALAAAGLRWAPSAAAEPGANPVTGTRGPLTMAEPTDTKGVRASDC